MENERKKTKIPGVRYREHQSRKNGIQKDRYYFLYYQLNKKQKEEGVGWASQGWTEKKAAALLFTLKENIRLGKHPQTITEMRELDKEAEETREKEKFETITFKEVFQEYLQVHKIETSEKTWMNTERYYRLWIDSALGKMKIKNISIDDIQGVITNALKKTSSRTADFIKAVIRQIFNFAKSRDLYSRDNPAMKIKIKLTDNKRIRFLTRDEAKLLLDALISHSLDVHDMALLSLYSGLRAGEVCNLKWEFVNWSTKEFTVVNSKNGEDRTLPMHPLIEEMLQQRYEDSKFGYVFKSRTGEKIEDISDTFQRTVNKLGFNSGITDAKQKVVFHTLRHTYASWLVMAGVDLYTVQKLMGHKSIQMTQRYSHLAPGHLEKAVNKLERI